MISHSNDAVFIPALVAYDSMVNQHWFWLVFKLEVEDTTLAFLLCLLYFNHRLDLWLRLIFYFFFFYSLIFLIDFLLHQLSDSLLQLTGYDV